MDIKEQLIQAHAGDREARNRIVEENMGLVWSIVKRFSGRGYDEEDLFQIGCIGLIKAIDRFDMGFEVRFSTYAVPMITGEIKRFLRDDGMIKVSRTIKENSWKIKKAVSELGQELGRNVTVDEIAAATELKTEDIILAMEAGNEVDSIYRTIYESEGKDVALIDQVVGAENGAVGCAVSNNGIYTDAEKEEVLNKMLLEKLLGELDEMERNLIKYRYFQGMTQTQVAKIMGISQVQVSRLEKKILLTMRKKSYL